MQELIIIIVALSVLIIGSIQDLKKREVMDWLTIGLIFYALLLRLIFSVYKSDFNIILQGLIGLLICYIISLVLFYSGQWGGGDSKLLMGMGALLGHGTNLYIFTINIFLAGAFYGLIYSSYIAVKNWKNFKPEFIKLFKANIVIHRVLLLLAVIILVALMYTNPFYRLPMSLIVLLCLSMFYLYVFTKSVEKGAMIKKYNPKQLTEGDWIVKDIVIDGKYITGPKELGITKKQIKIVQKLHKQNKIHYILVKEGIPFIPSFLFGYVGMLIYGNWLIYLF